MALKGYKLNLPYYFINSLEKMAYVVHNTIGDQDQSLFHQCLWKILIQSQLSIIDKSWDQFLVENNFGQTWFWPPFISKSRKKRRKPSVNETPTLNPDENTKEINDSQPALSKDSGDNLVEGNHIPMVRISINSQLVWIGKKNT